MYSDATTEKRRPPRACRGTAVEVDQTSVILHEVVALDLRLRAARCARLGGLLLRVDLGFDLADVLLELRLVGLRRGRPSEVGPGRGG